MKQGKNYARWTYYSFWLIGNIISVNFYSNIVYLISIIPGLIAAFFLFNKEANEFFKSKEPIQFKNEQSNE